MYERFLHVGGVVGSVGIEGMQEEVLDGCLRRGCEAKSRLVATVQG